MTVHPEGFEWVELHDAATVGTCAYIRKGDSPEHNTVLVALNFHASSTPEVTD